MPGRSSPPARVAFFAGRTSAPPPPPPPVNSWYPYPANPGNTGYQNAPGYPGFASFTDGSTLTPSAGQAYSFYNFPSGLDFSANNVTFTGCRFASNDVLGADVTVNGTGATFRYCTFEPSTVTAGHEPGLTPQSNQVANGNGYQFGVNQSGTAGPMTVDHCRFWGYANAIQLGPTSGTQITTCLFQNPRDGGGTDHTDGPGELNGLTVSNLTISKCTILGIGSTNGIALQGGQYSNFSITGNYVSGYGYMCFLGFIGSGQTVTSETFTGNLWGTDVEPGVNPLYPGTVFDSGRFSGDGNYWHNNKIYVQSGTSWMAAGNQGLYWWPSDLNPPDGVTVIGHATDYVNT